MVVLGVSSSPFAGMSATIGVSIVLGQPALMRTPRGVYSRLVDLGVAMGAMAVEVSEWARGHAVPETSDFATAYVVDAHWPQKPSSAQWAAMPGVAVDAHDNVWLFT